MTQPIQLWGYPHGTSNLRARRGAGLHGALEIRWLLRLAAQSQESQLGQGMIPSNSTLSDVPLSVAGTWG